MNKVYADDYPRTLGEAIQAAKSVKDEDIDYSDIPELTDEELAQFQPVGDRFRKMAQKNMEFINSLLNEYYAKKANAL